MKKFELGMMWSKDWHDFEVTKIFKNGKIQITETWISEDSGKECKSVEAYNVSEDEHGQFAWREKDKEYAFDENEEDGYHWWARTYAAGIEWGGITEEELIAELEEQGYEVKEQKTTTTNTTNKEEKKMARFEINGTIYEANDKGTYFYKSTGDVDKKGNPIMKRVSRAVYEQAFEEYTQQAQDTADADDEWMQGYGPELEEAWAEQEELKDREAEENFNKKHIEKTEKKAKKPAKRSKDVAFQHQDITLTKKQVDFIHEAQQTSFYEHGVQSTLWCDVLVDEIGGEFAGKPMTVGAMISTLKEKELVFVAVEKVNGKKSKYFGFTELGQQILEELG